MIPFLEVYPIRTASWGCLLGLPRSAIKDFVAHLHPPNLVDHIHGVVADALRHP
jgi:hypothetical protein